jgi:GT2 family glycosyltransferase
VLALAKSQMLKIRPTEYKAWITQKSKPGSVSILDVNVSILMATYNTPVEFLRVAVASVRSQTSQNWELCIADDKSSSTETLSFLRSIESSDPRIKIVFKDTNSGISDTLNVAIKVCSGQFIGVLDHDDALHPRAIELCLMAHKENSEAILIYSDEDKIDKKGNHSNPFFKPDFSPELLLSQMYLNHFTIMKTDNVKQVGAFRKEFDGAQDHDLALRLNLSESNVVHVPQVLYHWRAWEESTAMSIDAKPWAQTAAQKVQIAAMNASGIGGTSLPSHVKGLNEVHWNIAGTPTVGIVIPTANRQDIESIPPKRLVDQCLDSLPVTAGGSHLQVCIVHTGDLDPEQKTSYVKSGFDLIPFDRALFNFSHAINVGVSNLDTEFVLLLNDDTRMLNSKAIEYMIEYAQNPEIGVVGAKLSFPSKQIQHAGILHIGGLPTHPFYKSSQKEYGYYGSLLTPRNYLAVTAAAALIRRSIFDEVGGFDEKFAHDFNDIDFCLRVRERGYRNVWTPHAHFEHVEGASIIRRVANPDEVALFRSRYKEKLVDDPYYSSRLKQDIRHLYEYK